MSSKSLLNIPSTPSSLPAVPPPGQTKPIPAPTRSEKVPFNVPNSNIKAETWYTQFGTLSASAVPLICLHGGPGAPHNYLLPLAHLSTGASARPVIIYDQLGCGQSTHLPDKRHDTDFWTTELFMTELDNLISALGITDFDLLGQSWGGMLGAAYACKRPLGLRRLILADSPASMVTWVEVANELRKTLPEDVQATLTRCENDGTTDSDEYDAAVHVFEQRFVCRVDPFPKELADALAQVKEDNTVYLTMNGPSEFHVSGSLKTWDITSELHKINVPTLLLNGKYDEAQDIVMEPFFREIPGKVKWVRFAESSHTPQLEETESFLRVVGQFLE